MNYNKLILIFLLLVISLLGQDLNLKYRRNGIINTFATENYTSAFGRRDLDTSPLHKGLDYGGQAGDQLLQLMSGIVVDIRYDEDTRYKVVIIDGEESKDFGWKDIRLQRFRRLRTMNTLLWLSICLLYSLDKWKYRLTKIFSSIMIDRKLSKLNGFIYYKLTLVVRY